MDLQELSKLSSPPPQMAAGSGGSRFSLPSKKVLIPLAVGAALVPLALAAGGGPKFSFNLFAPQKPSQTPSEALKIKNEAQYLEAVQNYVKGKPHPPIVTIAQTNKTLVKAFPGIDKKTLFKVQKDLNLFDRRYKETESARAVIKELGLTKLYIPHQKLLTIDGKHILLEERCNLEMKDITGESAEDLDLVRQFAIFCCATGYWDIKQENNPFLAGKKIIVFVDLEFIRPPKANNVIDITMLCKKANFNPRQAGVVEQAFLDCGHKTKLDRQRLYGGSQ